MKKFLSFLMWGLLLIAAVASGNNIAVFVIIGLFILRFIIKDVITLVLAAIVIFVIYSTGILNSIL